MRSILMKESCELQLFGEMSFSEPEQQNQGISDFEVLRLLTNAKGILSITSFSFKPLKSQDNRPSW